LLRRLPVKQRTQGKTKANQPVAEAEGYLDKAAVAKRLGLKPRTISDWVRQGKLPAYRFGRYLRFKWDEVERALAATCRVATARTTGTLTEGE